ncbi:hypothetical protein QBC33DRAFT_310691 [Phialemonium atrogriseum]|uniref:RRM domain-containing protein n=1 Tax=Phialemonium atrogriseum TaxID=1093897 RepID=A0AAJ0FJL9_9PEZI|nr:uncharacterized protein QBC33DRAFT_310691 [Phialemonium atrogriseum]KAK1770067.1 hypothetical protein QBC33DRAFT_310691 [Phialemonium atrogriseum]
MAPHNAQWEAQIEGLRKNRRLLVARGIPFNATRAAFETGLMAKLAKPNSINFLWPPPSSANYSNQTRHSGWVMLAFNQRTDIILAQADLKEYKFSGHRIKIDRAISRVAYTSGSSTKRAAAPATTAPTIVAPTTTAPTTTATNPFSPPGPTQPGL